MKSNFKKLFIIGMSTSILTSFVYALPNTINQDTTLDKGIYVSDVANQNALLISGGKSTITNIDLTKSGDTELENKDYSLNAGLVITDGSTNIENGKIITNGVNSTAIMINNNAKLNIKNLNIETVGVNSPIFRLVSGNNSITVDMGTYKTNGNNSEIINTESDITIKNSSLIASLANGIIIDGSGKVTLDNTILNTNSEGSIILKQTTKGKPTFISKNSNITTQVGDTLYISNTDAIINLENNTLTNPSGNFLKVESKDKEKIIEINLNNQKVTGNTILDKLTKINMNFDNKSVYIGSINNNKEGNVTLKLSKDSSLILTQDTYLKKLDNSDKTNSNIYLNGNKLIVNDKELNANTKRFDESTYNQDTKEEKKDNKKEEKDTKKSDYKLISSIVILVILLGAIITKYVFDKKNK